jgi:amino-acid racemase
MRTLGVLGGMSWESTAVYDRLVNQGVARRRGGLLSASLLLHGVEFAPGKDERRPGTSSSPSTARQAGLGGQLLLRRSFHGMAGPGFTRAPCGSSSR